MASRIEQIVNQIYTFFAKSIMHVAELKEMQQVLNEPKLNLKQAAETRWLGNTPNSEVIPVLLACALPVIV